ncbi:MAG: hypothetical protein AMJ81_13305 [Phycisphaerae bacterium SM23_33]|nr:MAG: hypothetical protein AMJ81_13305 [Phycisphaerae bacterium SM23_33]
MVSVDGVTKRFGTLTALEDITVALEAGKTYGLFGENGAGKTTLVKVLSGTLSPDAGSVRVLGTDPAKQWRIRRRMGIVEDGDAYFPELTAREHLWWVGRLRGLDDARCEEQMDTLLHTFRVRDRADDLICSLSHGMRRKVCVASAFIGRPDIILLDEPTTGLDVDSLDSLGNLLASHRGRGGVALLASHNRAFLGGVCSEVIFLSKGRMTGLGSVEDLCDR